MAIAFFTGEGGEPGILSGFSVAAIQLSCETGSLGGSGSGGCSLVLNGVVLSRGRVGQIINVALLFGDAPPVDVRRAERAP